MVSLVVLLGTSSVLVGSRSGAAAVGPIGPVGPKTITVDGDPSDWTGTAPTDNTAALSNGEFIWNDTAGDDTGNGAYTYPTSGDFNPELFDVRELRITADSGSLYVLVKVGNLTNAWGGSDGFSTVAAVLLIDTTLDGGGTLTSRPNVNITAGQGWEYYVKIGNTGWQAENAKIFDTAGHWAPIVNKGNPALDSIEVSIPLSFIGKDGYDIDGATWGFMFFLQSHAGENADGFRSVTAAGAAYDFGGCDSGVYMCPKIEDVGFSLSKAAQEAELGTFATDHPATMSSSAQVIFASSIGFVPDTTPPAILSPTATPTFNQADISWATNETANTTVWYDTSVALTNKRSIDEFVTSHSVTLSGLIPVTTYYYQIESWDIAGNKNTSSVDGFTTLALPPANLASWSGDTFVWEDTRGDDTGDGNYVYPNEPTIKWQGRGDIWYVNMTQEAGWIHYSVRVNAKPETIWHQRMASFAMFIDQDHVVGSGARDTGVVQESDPGYSHPMNLSVAQDFAWEYMVLATFQNLSEFTPGDYRGEMIIRNNVYDSVSRTYGLVYMSTNLGASLYPTAGKVQANNGTQLDFWLNRSVIGTSDNWTYVATGALYDDAGSGWPSGGIRQIRPAAATWEGGGSNGAMNPNVYDLAFYPTTSSQETDLSEYVSTGFTGVSHAIQVNLTAKWYSLLSVTNVLAISSSVSVSEVRAGESAGLVSFVTNRNVPINGATVTLTPSPVSAVDVVGSPTTTNAFGAALFTIRGRTVAVDTTVALTVAATMGSNTITNVVNLLVRAPPPPVITHNYAVFLAMTDGVLATGGSSSVTATFTDKGAAIVGASVSLVASPSTAVDVTGSPATTNAQGQASFTVRGRYTETDITVSLTATATNGTVTTASSSLVVKGFVHVYSLSESATVTVVAANASTNLTFTFRDAGVARAGVQVTIVPSPATAFDVVGSVSKATGANGQATFELRAKPLASDTAVVVTATATNGTTAVATATVSVVAQGLPPATPTPPVTPQGVAIEVFAGVAVVLAVVALAFAYMWMRARRVKPPEGGSGEA